MLEYPLQTLPSNHKGASDGNIFESIRTSGKTEAVELKIMEPFKADSVSDSGTAITSKYKEQESFADVAPTMSSSRPTFSSGTIQKQHYLPKSNSLPVDLWKNCDSKEHFSFSAIEFPDDSSTISSTTGSRRSSLLLSDKEDSELGLPISGWCYWDGLYVS